MSPVLSFNKGSVSSVRENTQTIIIAQVWTDFSNAVLPSFMLGWHGIAWYTHQ